MDKELKCPKCGSTGTLVYQNIQQCAYQHKVLKNGKISKRKKFVYIGPEEWGMLVCENCGESWTNTDPDGFNIDGEENIFFEDIDEDD